MFVSFIGFNPEFLAKFGCFLLALDNIRSKLSMFIAKHANLQLVIGNLQAGQ